MTRCLRSKDIPDYLADAVGKIVGYSILDCSRYFVEGVVEAADTELALRVTRAYHDLPYKPGDLHSFPISDIYILTVYD